MPKRVVLCTLGDSGFFRHQDIVKATVSGVFEDLLSLKFQRATSKIEVFLSLPCWLSELNCLLSTTG